MSKPVEFADEQSEVINLRLKRNREKESFIVVSVPRENILIDFVSVTDAVIVIILNYDFDKNRHRHI